MAQEDFLVHHGMARNRDHSRCYALPGITCQPSVLV